MNDSIDMLETGVFFSIYCFTSFVSKLLWEKNAAGIVYEMETWSEQS